MKPKKDATKLMSVRLPSLLAEQLEVISGGQDRSKTDLVIEALQRYLGPLYDEFMEVKKVLNTPYEIISSTDIAKCDKKFKYSRDAIKEAWRKNPFKNMEMEISDIAKLDDITARNMYCMIMTQIDYFADIHNSNIYDNIKNIHICGTNMIPILNHDIRKLYKIYYLINST
jgi:predicted DNA-binding protein